MNTPIRNPQSPIRNRFEGVSNIVRFNWPMLAGSAVVSLAALGAAGSRRLPVAARLAAASAGAGSLWFLGAALAASHLIYDRSDLYRWRWLRRVGPADPRDIANLHAGFDETSASLRLLYPDACLRVLDFYDPEVNTEPSIVRARRLHPPEPGVEPVRAHALGLGTASVDLACCILTAHEIRDRPRRVAFLAQIRAALRPAGRLVVVEHLRDAANFTVFGPGALHFYSRDEWLRVHRAARLRIIDEFPITPFVRVFVSTPDA